MPQETRNYFFAITGMSVEDWAAPPTKTHRNSEDKTGTGCGALMALLKRAPFIAQLQQPVRRLFHAMRHSRDLLANHAPSNDCSFGLRTSNLARAVRLGNGPKRMFACKPVYEPFFPRRSIRTVCCQRLGALSVR